MSHASPLIAAASFPRSGSTCCRHVEIDLSNSDVHKRPSISRPCFLCSCSALTAAETSVPGAVFVPPHPSVSSIESITTPWRLLSPCLRVSTVWAWPCPGPSFHTLWLWWLNPVRSPAQSPSTSGVSTLRCWVISRTKSSFWPCYSLSAELRSLSQAPGFCSLTSACLFRSVNRSPSVLDRLPCTSTVLGLGVYFLSWWAPRRICLSWQRSPAWCWACPGAGGRCGPGERPVWGGQCQKHAICRTFALWQDRA